MRPLGHRITLILRILSDKGQLTGVEITKLLGEYENRAVFTYLQRAENYGYVTSTDKKPKRYSIKALGIEALNPPPVVVRQIPPAVHGRKLMPKRGTPRSVFDLAEGMP